MGADGTNRRFKVGLALLVGVLLVAGCSSQAPMSAAPAVPAQSADQVTTGGTFGFSLAAGDPLGQVVFAHDSQDTRQVIAKKD